MLKITELATLRFIKVKTRNGEFRLSTREIDTEYEKSLTTFQMMCNNLKDYGLITVDVECKNGTKIKSRVIKITEKGEECLTKN